MCHLCCGISSNERGCECKTGCGKPHFFPRYNGSRRNGASVLCPLGPTTITPSPLRALHAVSAELSKCIIWGTHVLHISRLLVNSIFAQSEPRSSNSWPRVELGDVHRSLMESDVAPIRQPGYHRSVNRGLIRRALLVSGPSRLQRQSHVSTISNAIQL